jgi:hypothetical protein
MQMANEESATVKVLDGHDYVARTRLTTRAGALLADVGERCDAVPARSLPWLLEQGLIARAPEAPSEER